MAVQVMTFRPKGDATSPEAEAVEVARRISAWLIEHPGVRVINIETLLVRDGFYTAPYAGERLGQHVRVWLDVPGI